MNRTTVRTVGGVTLALAVSLPSTARRLDGQEQAERLLRAVADASRDDLSRLANGVPFTRSLASDTDRELTLVHAIRIRAPVEFILARAREDHLLLDDVDGPEARGVFSITPAVSDLERLEMERRELRQLRKCRVGDCALKLSASAIERMHEVVNWSAPDADRAAAEFLRADLVAMLEQYGARGHDGAPVYGDKAVPLSAGAGLDSLVLAARSVARLDPAFHLHLTAWPEERDPGVEDRFTWTVEDLGIKSVVSLNHVSIKPRTSEGTALIAVKRLYANHYFQAGLRLLILTPGSGDPRSPDTYVTVITSLRFDGEVGGLKRTAMERRLEMNADAVLTATRDRLEAAARRQ